MNLLCNSVTNIYISYISEYSFTIEDNLEYILDMYHMTSDLQLLSTGRLQHYYHDYTITTTILYITETIVHCTLYVLILGAKYYVLQYYLILVRKMCIHGPGTSTSTSYCSVKCHGIHFVYISRTTFHAPVTPSSHHLVVREMYVHFTVHLEVLTLLLLLFTITVVHEMYFRGPTSTSTILYSIFYTLITNRKLK